MKYLTYLYFTLFGILISFYLIILISCEKYEDRERNWIAFIGYNIYRLKCGPDVLQVEKSLSNKTGDEICAYQDKYTFEKWLNKQELTEIYSLFTKGEDSLFFVKVIQSLPDSLWVVSKCNCDPLVCTH